ncbi:MAG TPA: methionine--tRNA ligase subunit beta, partial [Desulfopila sp.]|nr:methionine--tRNA ligase subunit beta [Desulfopila sp.]
TMLARKNSDLANDLGNLFSRSLSMIHKYRDGLVVAAGKREESDDLLIETARRVLPAYRRHMAGFEFHKGLQTIWELVSQANKYIVVNEPWALAKDETRADRLDTVLYNLVESLRLLALTLAPVMPETAAKMSKSLGLENSNTVASLDEGGRWGVFPPETKVGETGALFPREDTPGTIKKAKAAAAKPKKKQKQIGAGLVSFDEFKKIELRIGEVVSAERVEKSDRLLLLKVRAHEERTVVAGLAEYYSPEELLGRQVLLVANLQPAKIMGLQSEGMLLAAKSEEGGKTKLVLATVGEPVKNGSSVS